MACPDCWPNRPFSSAIRPADPSSRPAWASWDGGSVGLLAYTLLLHRESPRAGALDRSHGAPATARAESRSPSTSAVHTSRQGFPRCTGAWAHWPFSSVTCPTDPSSRPAWASGMGGRQGPTHPIQTKTRISHRTSPGAEALDRIHGVSARPPRARCSPARQGSPRPTGVWAEARFSPNWCVGSLLISMSLGSCATAPTIPPRRAPLGMVDRPTTIPMNILD